MSIHQRRSEMQRVLDDRPELYMRYMPSLDFDPAPIAEALKLRGLLAQAGRPGTVTLTDAAREYIATMRKGSAAA